MVSIVITLKPPPAKTDPARHPGALTLAARPRSRDDSAASSETWMREEHAEEEAVRGGMSGFRCLCTVPVPRSVANM